MDWFWMTVALTQSALLLVAYFDRRHWRKAYEYVSDQRDRTIAALAGLNDKMARRAQLAKERAAAAHNEHPERPQRPRCTAKTRRGLQCTSALGTQYAHLCKQHAASMWDRYIKQQQDRHVHRWSDNGCVCVLCGVSAQQLASNASDPKGPPTAPHPEGK